jgi:1-acyl-sn-glycerol-3-phosphate acyltransferase
MQQRVRRIGRPIASRLWKIELSGYERLPVSGPAILCPNHISFLDSAFLMLTVPRNISFVGKAEYMDSWKTKYLFPAMGMIPIDRSGGDKSTAALDAAEAVLRRGELFGIFPEGTRSRNGNLHKGRTGRSTSRDEARLPDLPGRRRRHRRDPAARREGAEAVQPVRDQDRTPDPARALPGSGRRAHRLAVDDRRGHVRDPRADRTDLRQHLRRRHRRDRAHRGGPGRLGHRTGCAAPRHRQRSLAVEHELSLVAGN